MPRLVVDLTNLVDADTTAYTSFDGFPSLGRRPCIDKRRHVA
jgi:hypothetical protein